MRNKLVEVMAGHKSMESRALRYGLQLFADDSNDGASGSDDTGSDDAGDNGAQDKDDHSDGEKKYTDEEVDALIER